MDYVSAPLERLPSLLHILFTVSNLRYTAQSTEDERITKIKHMRGTRTAGISQMERVTAAQEKNDKCETKLSSEPTAGSHYTKHLS
jgi:hypothetical protein